MPATLLAQGTGRHGLAVSRIVGSLKDSSSSGLHRAWRQAQQARHEALWKKTSVWESLQRILQQVLYNSQPAAAELKDRSKSRIY